MTRCGDVNGIPPALVQWLTHNQKGAVMAFWFIGASVGLIVGLIAFLVASRLFNEHEGGRPERRQGAAGCQR